MSLRRPAHDTDGSPDAKPRAAPAPRQRTPLPPALPPQRFWNPFTWIQGVRDLCAICVLALQLLVPNIAVIAAAQAARWTVEAWVTPTVVAPAVRAAVTKSECGHSRAHDAGGGAVGRAREQGRASAAARPPARPTGLTRPPSPHNTHTH